MKKLLLTLIVSFAFCGSMFAQPQFAYESNWPGFIYNFENQTGLCAAIAINGHVYTVDDPGWDALEVAFFVNGQLRGTQNYLDRDNVDTYGDPYPILPGAAICYSSPGEVVDFQMFDHVNEILYTECYATYLDEPLEIVTGPYDYFEAWLDEPYLPVILWFTGDEPAAGISKEITGYNETDTWYFLSSPIGAIAADEVETKVTDLVTGSYDFFYLNQTGSGVNIEGESGMDWMNYKMQPFGFEVGKAYLYAKAETDTITFNGTAYDGEGTFDLAYEEVDPEVGLPGYNLMGNPYNSNATVDKEVFYEMNGADIVTNEDDVVGPMEGVLIIVNQEGTVTFTPGSTGSKTSKLDLNLLNGQGLVDRAAVSFSGSKLPKFQINSSSTKLYIPMDDKDYAVVSSEAMGDIPVAFKTNENGSYTICVNTHELSFGYLHLIDNKTGMDVDLLATPSYSFDALTTDYANRFRLVFATGNGGEDNFAFYSNGNLVINNEGEAMLQVVDVTGRILSSESINGCASVNVEGAAGVYMIRLINGDNVKVQKVVVR